MLSAPANCKGGPSMRIALASYQFINNDINFNLSQIKKAMKAASGQTDLLCFGESFLQGFDALNWEYEADREIAIRQDSDIITELCQLSKHYTIDILIGYFEHADDAVYSSSALIEKGRLLHNFRRISKGWKIPTAPDEHYKEGSSSDEFIYQDRIMKIALCGDMWEYPDRFITNGILLWPVYLNFSIDVWRENEVDYAEQAKLASSNCLMINSLSDQPRAHGGAFYFKNGEILARLEYDQEGILFLDIW